MFRCFAQTSSGGAECWPLTSFMPTSSPVCRLVPRKISPKEPPPSFRPSLYFPAIRMSREHIAVAPTAAGCTAAPDALQLRSGVQHYFNNVLVCCSTPSSGRQQPGRLGCQQQTGLGTIQLEDTVSGVNARPAMTIYYQMNSEFVHV
jgi:hypothetical protein